MQKRTGFEANARRHDNALFKMRLTPRQLSKVRRLWALRANPHRTTPTKTIDARLRNISRAAYHLRPYVRGTEATNKAVQVE